MPTNYFVDFSASNNGNGSDGAQAGSPGGAGAFNQLTSTENLTIASGDSVYLRRTGSASTKTITFKNGVNYFGWPKSTDENYATRPSNTVDSTWNADSSDYAVFTGPTAAWTPVTIQCWRLDARNTATGNRFLSLTGSHQDFFVNHCMCETTTGIPITIGGSITGVGAFKVRDTELKTANASATFAIDPNNGPTGYVDIEVKLNHTVSNNNDFTITLNPNSTATNIMRFIVTDYVNAGTARITWAFSVGSAGMFTGGYGDNSSQKNKNNAITVGSPNPFGHRVKLYNIDQTGHSGAQGLEFTGSRDSAFVEAINCTFVGATNDIKFTNNSRARLIGRNISFDRTKVSFGSSGTVNDPDCQAIFVEGFGGTKGQSFRMNSRGFQLQSSATRSGGANQSILMETRSQGNPVGNPEPFLLTDGLGFEYLRGYLANTNPATVDVYVYENNWNSLLDASKLWIEVDYFDTGSGAHVKTVSTRDTSLSPAAVPSDGSTWSGVAGGSARKLTASFTPGQAGYCAVRVCVADSYAPGGNRSQVYVDPKIVVTQ